MTVDSLLKNLAAAQSQSTTLDAKILTMMLCAKEFAIRRKTVGNANARESVAIPVNPSKISIETCITSALRFVERCCLVENIHVQKDATSDLVEIAPLW